MQCTGAADYYFGMTVEGSESTGSTGTPGSTPHIGRGVWKASRSWERGL